MITLRPYQKETAEKAYSILSKFGLVYLALMPRVGKSVTAMEVAKMYGAKNVIFLTKKKAIASIESDYNSFLPIRFNLTVCNYESTHKINWDFDFVILDEAHCLASFPKPGTRTKEIKKLCKGLPIVYLSATPTAESYSQIYHQLWISSKSPFAHYTNFYRWADDYVNKKQRIINGFTITDYKHAKEEKVQDAIRPYMVNLSQEQAGFTSFVEEEIIRVPIDSRLYRLMDVLKKDKVYKMQCGDYLIADTPVKLQSLFHQISSGTVIASDIDQTDRRYHVIDKSKAYFIKSKFAGQKICIFYKFISEGNLLREVFEDHTDSPEEFNKRTHCTFICQYSSGKEGTNVSTADAIVAYNIDFSATTYWQFRERMQTKDRVKASKLYWIFSEKGIENMVYKAVVKKKSYTQKYFLKDIELIGR